jgi:hypothetical protein
MQGIFADSAFFAKVRLENIREFSGLQLNSLRPGRELIREQGIRSAEQGIWGEIDPRAPNSPIAVRSFL